MISPIVGTGTLVAGVLLGSLPSSLLAMGQRWGESLGWAPADCPWRLRRGFVIPTVVLLPFVGWLCDILGPGGPKELTIVGLLALAVGFSLLALIPQPQTEPINLLGIAVASPAWRSAS